MDSLIACSIASNNYLPFLRVFAKSFLRHNPSGRVIALVVDRPADGIDYAQEPFEVVFAEELGIPSFLNMAFRYSVLELNTALKPFWLIEIERRFKCQQVCYFDPDILVTDDLTELYEELSQSDLLLTPHATGPLNDDLHPSEADLLVSGIYNLGFLGVSFNPPVCRMLRWWRDRLHRFCLEDPRRGLFVDQKWMDFAPAFLDGSRIVRKPGYNVAYWNLHERRLRQTGESWEVEGEPLRFFHFSGIEVTDLDRISRHQNRFSLSNLPELRPLFEGYTRRLEEEGLRELAGLDYAYGRFDNGLRIPACARRTLHFTDPSGKRWPNPFKTAARDSFFEWLRESAPGLWPLNRIAVSIWESAPVDQELFRIENPGDRWRYLRKLTEGEELAEALAPEAESATASPRRKKAVIECILAVGDSRALEKWIRELGEKTDYWLNRDAALQGVWPRISRLAMEIHRQRIDLKEAFPFPLDESRRAYARWIVTHGRADYGLPPAAVKPILSTLPPKDRMKTIIWHMVDRLERFFKKGRSVKATPRPALEQRFAVSTDGPAPSDFQRGFHLAGYFEASSGVAQSARGLAAALKEASLPLETWTIDPATQLIEQALPSASSSFDDSYAALLIHANADMTPLVMTHLPTPLAVTPLKIGYWYWELEYFPIDFAVSFEGLDEVWAPSKLCLRAFSSLAPIPIRWVPPGVRFPQRVSMPRRRWGLPDNAFLFLTILDVRSIAERKNPHGLLKAFRRLVAIVDQPAHLVVKMRHLHEGPPDFNALRDEAGGLPVTFLTQQLSRQEVDGLLGACDCYVSLHRSEGLGLPMIEAMSLGMPVVATGYGGCADFLDDSTGWPISYRMKTIKSKGGPYPTGAVWADPDPLHAAQLMARVMEDEGARRIRCQKALGRVQELYSPQSAGKRFSRELDRLMAARGE